MMILCIVIKMTVYFLLLRGTYYILILLTDVLKSTGIKEYLHDIPFVNCRFGPPQTIPGYAPALSTSFGSLRYIQISKCVSVVHYYNR